MRLPSMTNRVYLRTLATPSEAGGRRDRYTAILGSSSVAGPVYMHSNVACSRHSATLYTCFPSSELSLCINTEVDSVYSTYSAVIGLHSNTCTDIEVCKTLRHHSP